MSVKLQDHIADWYRAKGFEGASPQTLMIGVMEEVGELAEAVLLTQCEDFEPNRHKLAKIGHLTEVEVAREVGDVLTYLMALCNRLGIVPILKPAGMRRIELYMRIIKGPRDDMEVFSAQKE